MSRPTPLSPLDTVREHSKTIEVVVDGADVAAGAVVAGAVVAGAAVAGAEVDGAVVSGAVVGATVVAAGVVVGAAVAGLIAVPVIEAQSTNDADWAEVVTRQNRHT